MSLEHILFVGGAASGKSSIAQCWAESKGHERYFIATNKEKDLESVARIAQHQAQRGEGWHTIEATEYVLQALTEIPSTAHVVLIDCVSLWLSNLCLRGDSDAEILAQVAQCVAYFPKSSVPIGIVSNEVGQGIVPLAPLARRYRNIHGKVNQILAAACPTVLWVACGLPQALKGNVPATLCNCL